MGKTAAEFIASLEKNKEYLAQRSIRDKHFSELAEVYAQDEKSLINELNQAGFRVTSVWDFVNSENDYHQAEPILVKHLHVHHHPKVLAGICRALAVPEFSYNDELWSTLIDLYEKTLPDSDIEEPEERGLQEAIAISLELLATQERVVSLRKLVTSNPDGDGIQRLRSRI